jgi:hypothetical protein
MSVYAIQVAGMPPDLAAASFGDYYLVLSDKWQLPAPHGSCGKLAVASLHSD